MSLIPYSHNLEADFMIRFFFHTFYLELNYIEPRIGSNASINSRK